MKLTETGAIPAAVLPVAALSEELRLGHGFADDGAEDALLERLLRDAMAVVERRTGVALIRRGFELEVSAWDRRGHLVLPVGPVEDLTSLELRLDGDVSALSPGDWRVTKTESRQRVTGGSGGSLPLLAGDLTARLVFDAGFGPDWTDVPHDLDRATMMLAAHYYEAGSSGAAMPAGVLALTAGRAQVRL